MKYLWAGIPGWVWLVRKTCPWLTVDVTPDCPLWPSRFCDGWVVDIGLSLLERGLGSEPAIFPANCVCCAPNVPATGLIGRSFKLHKKYLIIQNIDYKWRVRGKTMKKKLIQRFKAQNQKPLFIFKKIWYTISLNSQTISINSNIRLTYCYCY